MGSNMEFKNKVHYEFIDLSDLDDNMKSQIEDILQSDVGPDTLMLPWCFKGKNYDLYSFFPKKVVDPIHRYEYGLKKAFANLEVTGKPAIVPTSAPVSFCSAEPFRFIQNKNSSLITNNSVHHNNDVNVPDSYPARSSTTSTTSITSCTNKFISFSSTKREDKNSCNNDSKLSCQPNVFHKPHTVVTQEYPTSQHSMYIRSPQSINQLNSNPCNNSNAESSYLTNSFEHTKQSQQLLKNQSMNDRCASLPSYSQSLNINHDVPRDIYTTNNAESSVPISDSAQENNQISTPEIAKRYEDIKNGNSEHNSISGTHLIDGEIEFPSHCSVSSRPVPSRLSFASILKNKNTEKESNTTKQDVSGHQSSSSLEELSYEVDNKSPAVIKRYVNNLDTYQIGEFLNNYQIDKQTISLIPRGLTNRSIYCYINSILQALLACPLFYNLLRALSCSRSSLKNLNTPVMDNMIRFINEFSPVSEDARLQRKDLRAQKNNESTANDIRMGIAFEPSYVYTMFKNSPSARGFSIDGRQEDAEEFLSCLLNSISEEMLELMKQTKSDSTTVISAEEPNANCENGSNEWKVMGPRNKGSVTRCTTLGRTPLSDIFRGQLRSRVYRQGQESTDNVQPFFTLQLDIEKAQSVQNALDILVCKDRVEGMVCSKTKKQITAWKQVTLEELPAILILHLKWFDYKLEGCSKIIKNVTYSIDLKIDNNLLSPNVAKKLTPKQRQYKLFAVTYHDGKEATKGHYITDAYHVGYGTWVRYDDSSVRSIFEMDVLNPKIPRVPYLLYYRRCDTIGSNQRIY
ncbi:ubiquitin carboxyl-terminal hydrolase 10-A [Microplitis demolitor]|uniref:ubiquitin carboxyl-terminal hydrolase 10-A n=1 Tax=Microplitis demolitor TaxID=69319 RepID=UPI0004CD4548|nr:ubiquitin carboxyl-terminal hydrolase 10-A [Microplitis demolitor]